MTYTPQQIEAASLAVLAVVEAFKDAGPMGLPAGPLFAVLLTQGISLSQFNEIMSALENCKVIRRIPGMDRFAIV